MKQRLEELQQLVDSQQREGLRLKNKGHGGSTAISNPVQGSNTNDSTDSIDDSSIDAPNTPENDAEVSHFHPRGKNTNSSPAQTAHVPVPPPQLASEKHYSQPLQEDRDEFSPQFVNISLPSSPHFPSSPPRDTRTGPALGSEQMSYPYVVPNNACQNPRMQPELMQDCFMQDCSMHYHTSPVSRTMESDPYLSHRDLSNQKVLTGMFLTLPGPFNSPPLGLLTGASHVTDTVDSHPRQAPALNAMSEPTFQDHTSGAFKMPPISKDSWKQSVLTGSLSDAVSPKPNSEKPRMDYLESLNSQSEKQSRQENSIRGRSNSPLGREKSCPLGKDPTLDDRFEYILECAKQVGFDDFDSLVANYYTAEFSDCSILSNEQRLSRNRRLPGILAKLREKSEGWTKWERQGYQDEILKSAETIFAAECKSFSEGRNFQDGLFKDDDGKSEGGTRPLSSPASSGSTLSSQAMQAIKRTFQNEVGRIDFVGFFPCLRRIG